MRDSSLECGDRTAPSAQEGAQAQGEEDMDVDGASMDQEAVPSDSRHGGVLRGAFAKLRQHSALHAHTVDLATACAPFLDSRDSLDARGVALALQAIGVGLTEPEAAGLHHYISRAKCQGDASAKLPGGSGVEVSELCWNYYRHDTTAEAQEAGAGSVRNQIAPEHRHNVRFAAYYRKQAIVPAKEWDEFLAVLRSPLPMALRVNESKPAHGALRGRLCAAGLEAFPWYPGGFSCSDEAFHANVERKNWIRAQHRSGLVTFQVVPIKVYIGSGEGVCLIRDFPARLCL